MAARALRAFEAAGGDELVQQAEAKPEDRAALIEPVLDGLGAFDSTRAPTPTD
jgi:hypothetical protein